MPSFRTTLGNWMAAPCPPMQIYKLLTLLLLVVLSLSPLSAQSAEPWPTKKFKVFSGNPFIGTNQVGATINDELIGFDWFEFEDLFGPGEAAIDDIEWALFEAAQWYEERGFPPPMLEPLINSQDGLVYQVYVCSEQLDNALMDLVGNITENMGFELRWGACTNSAAGSYGIDCGNSQTRRKALIINSETALGANGKLNELGYQSVAHELMHAIIANTPLGRAHGCSITGWISESLPDAISFDIAEDIWKTRYQLGMSSAQVMKRYGYRPYFKPLSAWGNAFVPNIGWLDIKYVTSSFWRYVADSHPDGWKVLITPESDAAPGLLDLTMDGNEADWRREVDWLNKGLKGKFNEGLNEIYGSFVTQFAYLVPPMKSYQGKPAEANLDHWVMAVYGECASVDLSSAASQTITLDLERIASRCIYIEPVSASGLVQTSFQAGSDDLSLLQDISIGTPEYGLISRATPIAPTPHLQTQYMAIWRDFPQDGSQKALYLVSNVARKPSDTKPRQVTLTVARSTNDNSARSSASLPPKRVANAAYKPRYEKHARTRAKQKRATADAVAEQMNLDKESLNPDVSSATTIHRRPDNPACPEPFRFSACGPQLTINLSLMPGTYIVPGQTSGQGGMAAQAFGGLMAMSQTSLFDSQERIQHLTALIESIDGSQVNIAVPMIDYGQTPTINNAYISVDMSGKRTWRAIGPPDEQGRMPLRGTVSITEYTPYVISGTFSAPLAEFVASANDDGPAVYTQRGTVTGTFNSVAPWLVDERITFLVESNEQLADDIANALGIPAGMVHKMKQDGTMPGSAGPTSGSGGSSSMSLQPPECTCECSMKPFADELCELLCEDEFAACKNP